MIYKRLTKISGICGKFYFPLITQIIAKQVLTYLKPSGLKLGLLINFKLMRHQVEVTPVLGVEFLSNQMILT